MSTNEERRAVEALAQVLYEATDSAGGASVKRAQTIREPWTRRARKQLMTTKTAQDCE